VRNSDAARPANEVTSAIKKVSEAWDDARQGRTTPLRTRLLDFAPLGMRSLYWVGMMSNSIFISSLIFTVPPAMRIGLMAKSLCLSDAEPT